MAKTTATASRLAGGIRLNLFCASKTEAAREMQIQFCEEQLAKLERETRSVRIITAARNDIRLMKTRSYGGWKV